LRVGLKLTGKQRMMKMNTIIIVETVQGFITELRDKSINSSCYIGTLGTFEEAEKAARKKAATIGMKTEKEVDFSKTS
jgi:hypothetical protein